MWSWSVYHPSTLSQRCVAFVPTFPSSFLSDSVVFCFLQVLVLIFFKKIGLGNGILPSLCTTVHHNQLTLLNQRGLGAYLHWFEELRRREKVTKVFWQCNQTVKNIWKMSCGSNQKELYKEDARRYFLESISQSRRSFSHVQAMVHSRGINPPPTCPPRVRVKDWHYRPCWQPQEPPWLSQIGYWISNLRYGRGTKTLARPSLPPPAPRDLLYPASFGSCQISDLCT